MILWYNQCYTRGICKVPRGPRAGSSGHLDLGKRIVEQSFEGYVSYQLEREHVCVCARVGGSGEVE